MRISEIILEDGKHLIKAIDPLANSMFLFTPRRKKKQDPDDSPYKKWPKNVYGTNKLVSREQKTVMDNDETLKRLRDRWMSKKTNYNSPEAIAWRKEKGKLYSELKKQISKVRGYSFEDQAAFDKLEDERENLMPNFNEIDFSFYDFIKHREKILKAAGLNGFIGE